MVIYWYPEESMFPVGGRICNIYAMVLLMTFQKLMCFCYNLESFTTVFLFCCRDDDWFIEGKTNTVSFPSYYIDENVSGRYAHDTCEIALLRYSKFASKTNSQD